MAGSPEEHDDVAQRAALAQRADDAIDRDAITAAYLAAHFDTLPESVRRFAHAAVHATEPVDAINATTIAGVAVQGDSAGDVGFLSMPVDDGTPVVDRLTRTKPR